MISFSQMLTPYADMAHLGNYQDMAVCSTRQEFCFCIERARLAYTLFAGVGVKIVEPERMRGLLKHAPHCSSITLSPHTAREDCVQEVQKMVAAAKELGVLLTFVLVLSEYCGQGQSYPFQNISLSFEDRVKVWVAS